MTEPLKKFLRAAQVAHQLGLNVRTIYGWVQRHGMPHMKVDEHYLFNQDDVVKWLEHNACMSMQTKEG
jgi:excisionase family DNA binding protein